MEGENPSVRFFCLNMDILDNLLKDIEELRKYRKSFSMTLELYIEWRKKAGCEGCKIGENVCKHWSPEKIEVNWS